ncbi:MAG: hypothetical protein ACREPG_00990 [Candidatus Binatia bacterium]
MLSENLYQILLAGGGAFVVCAAIFAALWKLSMDAILEKFKSSQAEAMERLKNDLAQSTARVNRYEDARFGAYQEIWDALSDLRLSADRLWERATQRNVDEFGRHFEAVRRMLYGREVLIPEPHLGTLRGLIYQFRDFYDGKQGLLSIRRTRPHDEEAVATLIACNGRVRIGFNDTLGQLAGTIRNQQAGQVDPRAAV